MKLCTKCKIVKENTEFTKRSFMRPAKDNPDGLHSWCKSCKRKDATKRYKERKKLGTVGDKYGKGLTSIQRHKINKEEDSNRGLLRTYGISLEDKKQMLVNQKYLCALCNKPLGDNLRFIFIDHNHLTGRIRGLIHGNCNTGLHYIEDTNYKLLAEAYLNKYDKEIKK